MGSQPVEEATFNAKAIFNNTELRAAAQQAAAVLSDPNSPEQLRDPALNLLEGVAGAIACGAARRFPAGIRQELESEAFFIYYERRHKFDPGRAQGDFVSWFAQVLRNFAIDLDRSIKRGWDRQKELGHLGRQDERCELRRRSRGFGATANQRGELAERFEQISSVVEGLEFEGPLRGKVSYGFVFRLSLRLAVIASLSQQRYPYFLFNQVSSCAQHRARVCRIPGYTRKHCERVEGFLPWEGAIDRAPLCQDWHSLGAVWDAFKLQFISGPVAGVYSVNILCEAVNSIPGDFVRLTPEKWYQWVKRAKERARSQVDEGIWTECFLPLLPDHRTAGTKKA